MKRVLIFGTFDIIHPGHVSLIKKAKQYGEVHAVVARDETVVHVKGRVPMHSQAERMRALDAYGVIVHAGHAHDRLAVFREVMPQTVVLGHDQVVFVDQLKKYIEDEALDTEVVVHSAFHLELFKSSKIHPVLTDPEAGFLLVDKPSGEPSLRTVTRLRTLTGIKRIGFAGTLDPIASGLLVIGIAKAATLLDWWHLFRKTYEAEVELGKTSDTYDSTGTITAVSDRKPSESEVMGALAQFFGKFEQTPPMYSAKKHKGRRLYTLARKGEQVDRAPQPVEVHEIMLLSYAYPIMRFRVVCSTGTYIRSIAHELGVKLGTGALMSGLRRTAIGPYKVETAVAVADLSQNSWRSALLPVTDVRDRLCAELLEQS